MSLRVAGHQLPEEHILQLVCAVECPYTVVSAVLVDETLEDLSWDKLSDLGEYILTFVHKFGG